MRILLAAALLATASMPAQAQHHDHGHHQEESVTPPPAPPAPDPHAGDAGHVMPEAAPETPEGSPPPIPTDHAADSVYDPAAMAAARKMLRLESGGMSASMVMLDRLEYRPDGAGDGYHWHGEAWVGGDIDRLLIRSEGEGETSGRLEQAEVQALYSHAIDPWFNLVAGARHDIRPRPQRSYAVLGVEGLAPYWLKLGGSLFLSDKGDAHARIEASYDQRLTQRLILQPQVELNLAAQDVPALGIGSGLSDFELGLRLRYEIVREVAPYVGLAWERRVGGSARYARLVGEEPSSTSFVAGVRLWF